MKTSTILSGLSLLASALAQQAGTQEPEVHPKMTWQRCSGTGGTSCTTVNGEVVIDANWRWAHDVGGYENCFSGNEWTSKCSGNDDCAKNCAVEGANYAQTYGATTSGNALSLKFVTTHEHGTNIGSRLYLMESATKYQMFTLMNNELAFDVNLSSIPCGMNSALYLVPMASDGGMSTETNNNAGAKYGTGYCDAQCARDLKWIGGQGNYQGWAASATDENSGVGELGACCAEIDIWESNRESFAFTPHACDPGFNGYHVCKTTNCGGTYSEERHGGHCDANGCDYNPYRLGNHEFYGPGKTIDTNSKFTVVSRFTPTEATQTYIQNGVVHEMPTPKIDGLTQFPAKITADFCKTYPPIFEDFDRHEDIGGHASLVEALRLPMVLVMSVWGDHSISMLWLDSVYPPEKIGIPGTLRGRCPADGRRAPADLIRDHPNATVTWSNIKFGPIGSTYNLSNPGTGNPPTTQPGTPPTTQPGTPPTTPPAPQPTAAPPGNCAARWGQCGGQGWSGPTCCQSGSTCQVSNPWYSQCL